jgi:hypothetical protein
MSYSNSHKEENFIKKDFSFSAGDVIRVETNENELLFFNETKKKEHKIKMSLTE